MQSLQQLTIPVWPLEDNTILEQVSVTFQVFGLPLGTAPVIVINHSLQGDSDCVYHWDGVMGKNKAIDLNEYTVVCIDIPGNGVSAVIKYDYIPRDHITARDVAVLFWLTLFELEIDEVFAIIGADLGGRSDLRTGWSMCARLWATLRTLTPSSAMMTAIAI